MPRLTSGHAIVMPRPSYINTDRNDGDDGDTTTLVSTPTFIKPKKIQPRIQQVLETLQSSASAPQSAEPSKPKHDLKEEYKDFWTKQKEEEQRREKVRKGDGDLRPDLKEPWQKKPAKDTEHVWESPSGFNFEDTKGVGSSNVPGSKTSLEFPAQQHSILPWGKTAFEWALEPFLKDKPESRAYLAPTSSPSPSSFSFPSVGSSLNSGEVSACTDDAFPTIPLEKLTLYLRGKDEVVVRLKVLDVKITLLRCSILYCSAYTSECNERSTSSYSNKDYEGSGRTTRKEWYKEYSKAGIAAERAEDLTNEVGIKSLQARAHFWRGKAAWGMRYWDEAAAAFRDAIRDDASKDGINKSRDISEYGGNGLTPFERSEVKQLQMESERRNELKQQRKSRSSWSRRNTLQVSVDESLAEEETEILYDQDAGKLADEYADILEEHPEFMEVIIKLKRKYKNLPMKPFTKDEQYYILNGTIKAETIEDAY